MGLQQVRRSYSLQKSDRGSSFQRHIVKSHMNTSQRSLLKTFMRQAKTVSHYTKSGLGEVGTSFSKGWLNVSIPSVFVHSQTKRRATYLLDEIKSSSRMSASFSNSVTSTWRDRAAGLPSQFLGQFLEVPCNTTPGHQCMKRCRSDQTSPTWGDSAHVEKPKESPIHRSDSVHWRSFVQQLY